MCLLQSVRVPAGQSTLISVRLQGNDFSGKTMLLERDPSLEESTGLQVEDALVQPTQEGVAHVRVSNPSGFTSEMKEGTMIGEAVEATEISPGNTSNDTSAQQEIPEIRNVATELHDKRKQKLLEKLEEPDLPDDKKTLLYDFLTNSHTAFCLDDGERGETDLVEMVIDTGDTTPKKQAIRRMPFAARSEVAQQLKKMQRNGVIQPSKSPWSSPVVLVQKKDGTLRFCVDYRGLNAVTKADTFPLPRIDDLLDQLGKSRYFSTLDLSSGFWQIRIHPDSMEKTAFATPQGLYEFRVMPFGLTNAPSVFQRLMQQVLTGLNPDSGPSFISAYIDDILIFSTTLEQHLEHLRLVLQRSCEVGLKLNPAKCRFVRKEVEYLGHILTPNGLKPNPTLVRAVREFPIPTTVQELRRFLGLASYYRRFIPKFVSVAQPLHQLTCKGATFK